MDNLTLHNTFYNMGTSMKLIPVIKNSRSCGTTFKGDIITTEGYFWYYIHENHFIVAECDLLFKKDLKVEFSPGTHYITIRLDTADHIPPGKIVFFIEEEYDTAKTVIKAGTRIRYTDITYFPAFYEKRLNSSFDGIKDKPLRILKNMGQEHNWPATMPEILSSIKNCRFTGISAELYYVAKSYELMAELVEMGNSRVPRKSEDYNDILNVINYINASISKNLKQAELIRISNMSGTKLKMLFKKFTGKTITHYILEKRADMASHLLLDTDLRIEEIASNVGFATSTGFATSFKKVLGISPSEYRKKMIFDCTKNPSQSNNLSFGKIEKIIGD